MKFVAFQQTSRDPAVLAEGVEIGRVVNDETIVPLTGVAEFYADLEGWLARAAEASTLSPGAVPLVDLHQRPFVPMTAKVLCVGLNYQAHADEASMSIPAQPTVFGRFPSTLVTGGEDLPIARGEDGLDWEVELAVVIGKTLKDVDEADALDGVLGYSVFNDVSGRNRQFDTTQWTLGKNLDRSGPIGPFLVTADEFGEVSDRKLTLKVNGELMQSGNTADMIFGVARILSYISQTMTLVPGDVVATGTPEGIGFMRHPRVLMLKGDVVEAEIEGLGLLRNRVVC